MGYEIKKCQKILWHCHFKGTRISFAFKLQYCPQMLGCDNVNILFWNDQIENQKKIWKYSTESIKMHLYAHKSMTLIVAWKNRISSEICGAVLLSQWLSASLDSAQFSLNLVQSSACSSWISVYTTVQRSVFL